MSSVLRDWNQEKDKQKLELDAAILDALTESNRLATIRNLELELHTVHLKDLCKKKQTQLENDNKFRLSWRYGKIVAIFFMVIAFSFDVIQVNSVEPALDLIIKMFS